MFINEVVRKFVRKATIVAMQLESKMLDSVNRNKHVQGHSAGLDDCLMDTFQYPTYNNTNQTQI